MNMRAQSLLSLFLALPSGCGETAHRQVDASSAFEDARIPIWTVETDAAVSVGGPDERDGYFFAGVRAALIVADRLVVADGGSNDVRFYDLEGNLLFRAGGQGAGPGEFRSIGSISAVGDTAVAAWDRQLARLTVLRTGGDLLEVVTPDLGAARSIRPDFVGVFPTGELVFGDGLPDMALRSAPTGERRDSVQLLLADRDGTHRMWIRGSESWLFNEGTSWGSMAPIFGRSNFQAIAGRHLVIGWNDSLELAGFDSALAMRVSRVLPWSNRPVSEQQIEAVREHLVNEAQQEPDGLESATILDGRPIREVMLPFRVRRIESLSARRTEPAFADLRGDPLGNVWLAEFVHRDAPQRWWLVLDSMLTPIARVLVPADVTVLDISTRGLVTLKVDELGRERVDIHRIVNGGEAPQ